MTALDDRPQVDLPSPEEVQETFERMRAAVLAAAEKYRADIEEAQEMIAEAQAMIADAEGELASLAARYPMFFPEGATAATESGYRPGNPSVAQKNQLIHQIAARPGSTQRQIARQLGVSRSWCGRILRVVMDDDRGLIEREKQRREYHYSLTAAGRAVADAGGFREDEEENA